MGKKKILVTGAGGFLGSNAIEYLSKREDFEVRGVYRNSHEEVENVEMIYADLLKKEHMDKVVNSMDVVVHFASVTGGMGDAEERISKYVRDNTIMNANLFYALHKYKIPQAVLPSCSVMYQSSDLPLRESDFDANAEIKGRDHIFAHMKLNLENMTEGYSREGRTRFTVMRHSNMYGPRDCIDECRAHMFGANLGKIMKAKEGSTINVWGSGIEERDLLYVNDLSKFIEKSIDLQKEDFSLVNVGSGKKISVKDLIKKMIDISGKNLKIEFDSTKPSKNNKLALDSSKAYKLFKWKPEIDLDEGIKKTLEWHSSR